MSHGFSRFGPPSARERFHQQARGGGMLAMLLPTVFATLFLFTAVIALNKAASLQSGKTVRLINVDDVFPTPESVEQNRKKEYWETMTPPPSPDAVIAVRQDTESPPVLDESGLVGPVEMPPPAVPPRPVPAHLRTTSLPAAEIQPPAVAPDTSLPVATPTP